MDFVCVFKLYFLTLVLAIYGAPTYNSKQLDVDEYLRTYGYIDTTNNSDPSTTRQKALRLYQRYYDLETSGVVDAATYRLMTTSRCGVPDNPGVLEERGEDKSHIRPLAYKLSGPKWKQKNLRWAISRPTNQMPFEAQKQSFKDALGRWEEVSGLNFIYEDSSPDIDIRFVTRDHGDGSAFDGRSSSQKGNVLAHAFPPGVIDLSGDAHFDNDELWTVDINNKAFSVKYLEKVAAHEFGHSLGIHHSKVEGALMSAYYSSADTTFELHTDDIKAIQELYGKPSGWVPTLGGWVPTPAPKVPTCFDLFEAVVWGSDRKAYGIRMDQAYPIHNGRKSRKDSTPLQDIFPGAPVDVDFAFSVDTRARNGAINPITYMFMGRSIWKFDGYILNTDYPKTFHVDNLPEAPVAAVSVRENNKDMIMMIGQTKWWPWDETVEERQLKPKGYEFEGYWPHTLSDFPLVTTWTDGDIYLISPDSHVKLRERRSVDGYPKKGVPDWIYRSCPNSCSWKDISTGLIILSIFNMFHQLR